MFRNTNQRALIYQYLRATNHHPTAEQIFKAVKKQLPSISLATVYRNLQVLVDQGAIQVLHYRKDYARYEARMDAHYHFICQKCDKVLEVVMHELQNIVTQVESRHDLRVNRHVMYFFGLCDDCVLVK